MGGGGWCDKTWETRRRGVCGGVSEKGWGLVVGECSERMSGKAGIPQGSNKGLWGSVASLTQCMAVPSPRRPLP